MSNALSNSDGHSSDEDAAINSLVEAARRGEGHAELAAAFAVVSNPTNWQFSVEHVIEGPVSDDQYIKTMAAITFFTFQSPGSICEKEWTQFNSDGFAMNVNDDPCPVSREDLLMVMKAAEDAGLPAQWPDRSKAA